MITGSISFGGFGQSSGSGEGGLTQVTVKLGEKEYVSDGGIVTLPEYPTIPTNISYFVNDAEYATATQVDTKIAALVNAAPETLDTLGEIAEQIQANIGVLDVLTQSITTNTNNISGLQNYFTDGAANNALKLAGQDIEYFATAAGLTTVSTNLTNHISAYNTFKLSTEERLTSLEALWTLDEENGAVRTTLNLIVEKAISFGGFGQSSGGGGGLSQVTIKLGTTAYDSVGGVVSLPAYPSALSQLTNDVGFITSSALDGYLPKSGGTITSKNNTILTLQGAANNAYSVAYFMNGDTYRGYIGWKQGEGFCLYNSYQGKHLGIKDDGTPHYNGNTLIHSGNFTDYALPKSGGTMIGKLIFDGNIGIYDNDGNGILAALDSANTWTGVSGEELVAVGSANHKTVIRTSGDNLYHYNYAKGQQYKIYDSGNLAKETLGIYERATSVNGETWGMAGVYNTAAFTIYAPTTKGSSGQFLRSSGTGAPIWENIYWYDSSISRTANTVLAAPNGSNGVATFRALVAADIPTVNTVLCQEGTSNVNRPIVLTNQNNGLWYTSRALVNYATGDLTLYSESGNSPALIFQRGAIDDYTTAFDWKTFVSGGDLYFQNNYNGWTTKFKIDYYGEGYIDKLTIENNILTKEIYFAANGANGTKYSQYGNPVMGPNSVEWGVYSSSSKGLFLVNNNGNVSIGTDTYKGYIFEVDGAGKNIMFSSEVSPILKIKRTVSNGGAYIDYYSANSETHGWRVGHNIANEFVFAKYQNNVEKAIPLTIKESIIQALCGFMLSTTDGSAFNNYGVIFGNYLGRIGASNAGDIGIYASNGIYLRPASGSANSAIGVVIYQTGDVTMSHGLTVSSNIYTNGDIILNDTTGTSSISRKLKFLRRTESDDYWDYGLYAQSTKGLTFYQSANGVNTDIAYLDGYGNFVTTGGITFGSDARYKTKLSDATIDLETIANAPLFNYKWNDREDNKEHLGTTAQYWHGTAFRNAVIPTNDEKLWTMSYSEIAMGSSIILARELLPIKLKVSEIDQIKEQLQQTRSELVVAQGEIKSLKQQLNTYRRAS